MPKAVGRAEPEMMHFGAFALVVHHLRLQTAILVQLGGILLEGTVGVVWQAAIHLPNTAVGVYGFMNKATVVSIVFLAKNAHHPVRLKAGIAQLFAHKINLPFDLVCQVLWVLYYAQYLFFYFWRDFFVRIKEKHPVVASLIDGIILLAGKIVETAL